MMNGFVWDKNEWKRNAFDLIKQNLWFAKDSKIAGRFDTAREDHLVAIYGDTQIGKTTLILNMIGIKNECLQEVYNTLRADQPMGKSSTSTAVIYSRSAEENLYGWALRPLNAPGTSMEYSDDKGIVTALKKIRGEVESGVVDADSILFISIPSRYFEDDAQNDNISIIDLPGDNAKNKNENAHATRLMTKYIPISSVCIIACRANEIVSLSSLEIPNTISWRDMEHRFVLAITRAYSVDNIRHHLIDQSLKDTESIYRYVQEKYTAEIRNYLGINNKTEIYPLEVGQSLQMLCDELGKISPEYTDAIRLAQKKALAQLRASIYVHEGERLQSALADLRTVIYGNSMIKQKNIEASINKVTQYENKLKQRREADIKYIDGLRAYLEKRRRELASIETVRDNICNLETTISTEEIWVELNEWLKQENHFNFPNKPLIKCYGEHRFQIFDHIKELFYNLATDFCVKLSSLDSDFSTAEFMLKANLILPVDGGIFETTKSRKHGLIMNMTADDIRTFLKELLISLSDMQKRTVNERETIYNVKANEIKAEIFLYTNKQNVLKKELSKIQIDIDNCDKEKRKLNLQKKKAQYHEAKDNDTLEEYLYYTGKAYTEYRNKLVSLINRPDISAEDKIKLTFYMGVLDEDYVKITGGDQYGEPE